MPESSGSAADIFAIAVSGCLRPRSGSEVTRENRMPANDSRAKSHAEHALETEPLYGEKDTPFSEDEFADRLRRVRQEMAKREIDTLIVSDPANLYYLSGYQCSWYQDGQDGPRPGIPRAASR